MKNDDLLDEDFKTNNSGNQKFIFETVLFYGHHEWRKTGFAE